MDELPVQRQRKNQDEDAPLGRDDSSWFARQLGDEWQAEEPGVYRFVGPPSKPASAEPVANADVPGGESEAVKQGGFAPGMDVLKGKREHERALNKQRLARAEGVALKKKLASAGQPEQPSGRSNGPSANQT